MKSLPKLDASYTPDYHHEQQEKHKAIFYTSLLFLHTKQKNSHGLNHGYLKYLLK